MKRPKTIDYLIPFVVVAAMTAFSLTDFFSRLEGSMYNMLLRVKPAIAEHESILLVDFDDASIEMAGTWPVSRAVFADGILLMREFGAEYVVFDIEYVDTSPRGIDSRYLKEEIPERFANEFGGIENNTRGLFQALVQGDIEIDEAADFIPDLIRDMETRKSALLDEIGKIVRDNDLYLGRAAAVFGKAFFTVNVIPEEKPIADAELESYVLKHIPYPFVEGTLPDTLERSGLVPAIFPIISRGAGAGFPNVIIDNDGVRRRIDLLYEYDGKYFAQLAFRPLLDLLGNPKLAVSKSRIVMEDAMLPGSETRTRIVVPLAADGTMLINWPSKSYVESYRHLSFAHLIVHDELFDLLIKNLKLRQDWGYLDAYQGDTPLLDIYEYFVALRDDMLEREDPESIGEYAGVREYLLSEIGAFLNGSTENDISSSLDNLLERGYLSREDYRVIKADLPDWFASTRSVLTDLMKTRSLLSEALDGAFCITGHVGTSTTDIGVNPFEGEYMNVGTHASVANTILQRQFLDEVSPLYSLLLAMVLCFVLVLVMDPMKPLVGVLTGSGFLIAGIAVQVLVFVFTGIYSVVLVPATSVFLTFLTVTILKFLRTEREKSFLRDAFSHYLSTDVIREIVSDPDKLKLGGEERELTAMFTDIRGFSSISEKMTPNTLVQLLNAYLGAMSDTILDEHGTIDKFEGDAIMCFFGAPIDMTDHADRACRAATRMKRLEVELNKRFVAEELCPDHLITRIGVNTGSMAVGNMGTTKKMDYTVMGNAVNLASRLEGVNKFYGTWTMISEYTYDRIDVDEYVLRKLDRVRVVGIATPVRLYELVADRAHVDPDTVEGLEAFAEGLDLFEQREWEKAMARFEQVFAVMPQDAPAKQFAERCRQYLRKPPAESWDGVYNYSAK